MSADSVGLMFLLHPYSAFTIYLLKKMSHIFLDSGFSCLYPLDTIGSLSFTIDFFVSYCKFPGGSDGRVFASKVRDPGLILGLKRSPGEGKGNPFQYSCLGNPMDGGAW